MEKQLKIISFFSKIGYLIGAGSLYLIALWIIFSAIHAIIIEIIQGNFTIYSLLDDVSLIIFAIASIDVAKFLMTEEVIKGAERSHKEEKKSLVKFGVIIATALALEGLVLTIETSKDEIEKLVYPVMLLFASILFIIGIGLYQKMTQKVSD